MPRSVLKVLTISLLAGTALMGGPAFAAKKPAVAAASPSADPSDPVIATVNEDKVHRSDFVQLLQQMLPPGQQPTQDDIKRLYPRLLNELISQRLAYQEAVKEGLSNQADVKHAIATATQQILEHAYAAKVTKAAIADDKLKAAYDEAVKTTPAQDEVHARHILVKTEEEAKDIIKQLDAGGDFQKLAKEKSLDKSLDGGDLGFFTKGQIDPTVADAAFALQPNTYTKTPVKTQLGYDVIQVLEKRPFKIPPFEEAKSNLRNQVGAATLNKALGELAKGAKIQVYNLDGSPAQAPAGPPAEAGAPAAPKTPSNEVIAPLKLPQPAPQ